MPRINAIATALPALDVEGDYRKWVHGKLENRREAALYARMVSRSGIDHRWSVLGGATADPQGALSFFGGESPGTAARMESYALYAPLLALEAVRALPDLTGITHLVVVSCTGFVAPGVDQIIARELGLGPAVERVVIGFMGCYAGVTGLRTARHIARSDPDARILLVSVELCTLHLQPEGDLASLLAMGLFGDGAAALLISSQGSGLELCDGLSLHIGGSEDLITWRITDTGFIMQLSGEVPNRIASALARAEVMDAIAGHGGLNAIDCWAVHAGGRTVLDAVETGLSLDRACLQASRGVLKDCGNLSSATVLFVLQRLMKERPANGIALAFGPGMAMEGIRFRWLDDAAG